MCVCKAGEFRCFVCSQHYFLTKRNFTTALGSLNSVFLTLVYTALHSNTAKCPELFDGP